MLSPLQYKLNQSHSKSRSTSLTLPTSPNSDTEGGTHSSDTTVAAGTIVKEFQEPEHQTFSFSPPSSPEQPSAWADVPGTSGKPIDLTGEDDIDFQVQEEDAPVEAVNIAPSPPIATGDDTEPSESDDDHADVKMEDTDDSHMFPIHTSSTGLTADHLDLIYHIDGNKMVCRLCVYVCISITVPSPLC
jgi:hypothetical protein